MRSLVLSLLVGSVLAQASGCALSSLISRKSPQLDTSLLAAQGYSIPPGGMPTQLAESDSSGEPSITLEIRGDNEPKVRRVPLPVDRAVFADEVVRQGSLQEHLGRVNMSIMRPSGQGNPPIRMDVRFDDDGKPENLGTNYALLPGDHVIVIADQRSALERFITGQFK